ncbi:MAG TPA: hypothetical protein VF499_09615, partial [Afipia sp.]
RVAMLNSPTARRIVGFGPTIGRATSIAGHDMTRRRNLPTTVWCHPTHLISRTRTANIKGNEEIPNGSSGA